MFVWPDEYEEQANLALRGEHYELGAILESGRRV